MTVCNQNRVNCALVQSYLEYFMQQKKGNESIDEEKREKVQQQKLVDLQGLIELYGCNSSSHRSGSDKDHQKQKGF